MNSNPSQGGEYKKIDNYVFNPTSAPLGRGAFAAVYKAYDENRKHAEVAVKVIPATKLLENDEQYNLFMREIEVLRQIKGQNIVHLLDVKRTPRNLYIFTDFCNGGDLEKYIKKNGPLPEEEALKILKQITNAFIGLDNLIVKNNKGNRVSIMHRDIKPPNILFHDGEVRIADFGFAKIVDENTKDLKKNHTLLGTPLYMNPQTLGDQAYSIKCDVWSTGVVIYECIFKRLPWTGTTIPGLLNNIKKLPLEFPKPLNEDTKDLIRKMLQIREEDRIDWKGIWEHPALKRVKMPSEIPKEKPKSLDDGKTNLQGQTFTKPKPVIIEDNSKNVPQAGAYKPLTPTHDGLGTYQTPTGTYQYQAPGLYPPSNNGQRPQTARAVTPQGGYTYGKN